MKFDNEVFNLDDKVVNHNDAKAFIDEEYMDCEFPLDIQMFKIHQQRDEKLQKQIIIDWKQQHTVLYASFIIFILLNKRQNNSNNYQHGAYFYSNLVRFDSILLKLFSI